MLNRKSLYFIKTIIASSLLVLFFSKIASADNFNLDNQNNQLKTGASLAQDSSVPDYKYTSPAAGYNKGVAPRYNSEVKVSEPAVNKDFMDKLKVKMGVATIYAPYYEGSDDYGGMIVPSLSFSYDKFYASSRDGIGYNFVQDPNLTMSAALGYNPGRREHQRHALNGLGNVDSALTTNLYTEYRTEPFSYNLLVSADAFNQSYHGLTATMGAYYKHKLYDDYTFSFGPSATWASSNYMQAYYGVDNTQSQNSGYEVFNASSGFKDANLNSQLSYQYDTNTLFYGTATYTKLLGDAADSPISIKNNQYFFGVGVDYSL